MSKPTIAFALVLLLAGCHTAVNPTYTATGANGYRLSCGGFFGDGDLGSCYEKAGQICGASGYRVQQSGVSSMIVACRDDQSASTSVPAQQ